jgi:pimeloyl-ACP methyl ester carboxylesterase
MEPPETRYAKTPDGLSIAYQTLGDGPKDVVWSPYISCVEVIWEEPSYAHVLQRLAGIGRLICFDPRGVGAADPIPLGALPTPEARMDDLRAVLDTVGSTRASLVGHGFGGFIPMLFAATYPERTDALILIDAYARALWDEDYAFGWSHEMIEDIIDATGRAFGTASGVPIFAPSRAHDERFRRWHARYERMSMSQATVTANVRWDLSLDVRSVLPAISVPTLVMHQERSRMYPLRFGRYLADHIPGARFVALPGSDTFLFSDAADDVVDQIEEFITGVRPLRDPDRALATVLFTDVVRSTSKLADVGDRKWRDILDLHDAFVARELQRHRGKQIKHTGDGVLATFDGPARAVRCALAIVEGIRSLGIEIRAGLHTGEVELRSDDVGGIAVHIGQRVSALAGPGEVLVSRTVTDLVAGSGLEFDERGEHELMGVPGKWTLYLVKP